MARAYQSTTLPITKSPRNPPVRSKALREQLPHQWQVSAGCRNCDGILGGLSGHLRCRRHRKHCLACQHTFQVSGQTHFRRRLAAARKTLAAYRRYAAIVKQRMKGPVAEVPYLRRIAGYPLVYEIRASPDIPRNTESAAAFAHGK